MVFHTLHFPVQTTHNTQLLPAETILSDETMERLTSTSPQLSTVPFLNYSHVKKDLLKIINMGPYMIIFEDNRKKTAMLDLMEKVNVTPPVLHSLDYFRNADPYTYRHKLIVFVLSTLLAQDILEDREGLFQEVSAGPTHDFGKICVPLRVLRKTTPLTHTERLLLEHHASAGFVLLSYYQGDMNTLAARVARDHHERRDGSGYPTGKKQKELLVEIVAVSDVYDALISPRPYRPTCYDNRTALEEITDMAEQGKLNLEVVKALVAFNRRSKPHHTECTISTDRRGCAPPGNIYGKFENNQGEAHEQ
ncbi:MAG: HD-GYP domain-containing protein [Spirochaetota bacterium]